MWLALQQVDLMAITNLCDEIVQFGAFRPKDFMSAMSTKG
jgi:hypothetical protein